MVFTSEATTAEETKPRRPDMRLKDQIRSKIRAAKSARREAKTRRRNVRNIKRMAKRKLCTGFGTALTIIHKPTFKNDALTAWGNTPKRKRVFANHQVTPDRSLRKDYFRTRQGWIRKPVSA